MTKKTKPTIEEMLARLNRLNELIARLNRLEESITRLDSQTIRLSREIQELETE